MTEPIIRAQAVEKFYLQPDGNRIEVIAPVNLDVEPGKIITLLGPSGCGKSTLLRILTGTQQTVVGRSSLAREADFVAERGGLHRLPELCFVPMAHGARQCRSSA